VEMQRGLSGVSGSLIPYAVLMACGGSRFEGV